MSDDGKRGPRTTALPAAPAGSEKVSKTEPIERPSAKQDTLILEEPPPRRRETGTILHVEKEPLVAEHPRERFIHGGDRSVEEHPPTAEPDRADTPRAGAAAKLEDWLAQQLEQRAESEGARLEAWLLESGIGDAREEPAVERAAASAEPEVTEAIADSAPPQATGSAPRDSDQLEAWLLAHIGGGTMGAPVPPVRSEPSAPPVVDPIRREPAGDEAPPAETEEAAADAEIELATYAAIKVAVWDDGAKLLTALAEHDIDEMQWRLHERELADALQREAIDGASRLAGQVRSAIDATRTAREAAETVPEDELLALEEYARIRVALEGLDDEFQIRDRLLVENMSVDDWQAQRDGWSKRARQGKKLRKDVRRALSKARRKRRAKERAAEEEA